MKNIDSSLLGSVKRIPLFDGIHDLTVRILRPLTNEVLKGFNPDNAVHVGSKVIGRAKRIKDLETDVRQEQRGGHKLTQVYPIILFLLFLFYLSYSPFEATQQYWSSITSFYSMMGILGVGIPFVFVINFLSRLGSISNMPIFIAMSAFERKLSGVGFCFAVVIFFEGVFLLFKMTLFVEQTVFKSQWFLTNETGYDSVTAEVMNCESLYDRDACLGSATSSTSSLSMFACRWSSLDLQCHGDGFSENSVFQSWRFCSADGSGSFSSEQVYDMDDNQWEYPQYWASLVDRNAAGAAGDAVPLWGCNMNWDLLLSFALSFGVLCVMGVSRSGRSALLVALASMALVVVLCSDFRIFGRTMLSYYERLAAGTRDLELNHDDSSNIFKQTLMSVAHNDLVVQMGLISLYCFELFKCFWPRSSPRLRVVFITFSAYWLFCQLTPMYAESQILTGSAGRIINYHTYRSFQYLPETLHVLASKMSSYVDMIPRPSIANLNMVDSVLYWGQINGTRPSYSGTVSGESVISHGLGYLQAVGILVLTTMLVFFLIDSLADSCSYSIPERFQLRKEKSLLPSADDDEADKDEDEEPFGWMSPEDTGTQIPGLLDLNQMELIEEQKHNNFLGRLSYFTILSLVALFCFPIVLYLLVKTDPTVIRGSILVYFSIIKRLRRSVVFLITWLLSYFSFSTGGIFDTDNNRNPSSPIIYLSLIQCGICLAYGFGSYWYFCSDDNSVFTGPIAVSTESVKEQLSKRLSIDMGCLYGFNIIVCFIVAGIRALQQRHKSPLEKRQSCSSLAHGLELFSAFERAIYGKLLHEDGPRKMVLKTWALKFFALPFMFYFCGSAIMISISNVSSIIDMMYEESNLYSTNLVLGVGMIVAELAPFLLVLFGLVAFCIPTITANYMSIRNLATFEMAPESQAVNSQFIIPFRTALYENELYLNNELDAAPKRNSIDEPFKEYVDHDLASRLSEEGNYLEAKSKTTREFTEERQNLEANRYQSIFVQSGNVTAEFRNQMKLKESEEKEESVKKQRELEQKNEEAKEKTKAKASASNRPIEKSKSRISFANLSED
eukprot:GHVH01006135.1.p1 GENE.GHVH01006135.1~~GHVH01006135.1.p1  ORF type:complete len:1067 (+),score=141.97 GHVH01006135.1:92-3292(+)